MVATRYPTTSTRTRARATAAAVTTAATQCPTTSTRTRARATAAAATTRSTSICGPGLTDCGPTTKGGPVLRFRFSGGQPRRARANRHRTRLPDQCHGVSAGRTDLPHPEADEDLANGHAVRGVAFLTLAVATVVAGVRTPSAGATRTAGARARTKVATPLLSPATLVLSAVDVRLRLRFWYRALCPHLCEPPAEVGPCPVARRSPGLRASGCLHRP
jgi:hypothetical protein